MTNDQRLILLILFATVGLFLWGRWRHDMVAICSLAACVLTGLLVTRQDSRRLKMPGRGAGLVPLNSSKLVAS